MSAEHKPESKSHPKIPKWLVPVDESGFISKSKVEWLSWPVISR